MKIRKVLEALRVLGVLGVVAILGLASLGVVSFGLAEPVEAYTCDSTSIRVKSGGSASVDNPAECASPIDPTSRKPGEKVNDVINLLLSVSGLIAVAVIIYGGFTISTSAGDVGKVARGRKIIVDALVGMVIALLAYVIVNLVLNQASGK